jgi:hypothetical protein
MMGVRFPTKKREIEISKIRNRSSGSRVGAFL